MKVGKLIGVLLLSILLLAIAVAQKPTAKSAKKVACGDLMTQGEMNRCAGDEYRKADAELNKVYQQTMAKLGPEHKQKLKIAQLTWIQFRDAHCDCEAFTFDGGSMQPLIKFTCLEVETQRRTKQLKSLAEDASR
jgi:uncharacterized protein YecT (DUF1311 family)